MDAVERIALIFPSSSKICAEGLFVQTKMVLYFIMWNFSRTLYALTQVTVGQNLVFNSDCDRVPASKLVSMTIPQSIFDSVSVGAEISVLFTLYNSALLFPDDTDSSLRVNTSVIGATIDGVDTDNLTDNVTITFQLERNVSFCSEGTLTCLICETLISFL